MLTAQGWEDTDEDVSEGVQQHDQDTGPGKPVAGRGVLEEDFWILEAQASDREGREFLGNGLFDGLAGGDK